jgi:arsenite methyltransferase
MTLTCPVDFDTVTLRAEIQKMYSRVATTPEGAFHFHRGPECAVARLGYDSRELAKVPLSVTSSFAGAQIADIVIGKVLPESTLRDIDLWTG